MPNIIDLVYQARANVPARSAVAITPDEANPIPEGPTRAIIAATDGDVVAIFADDSVAVTLPLKAGIAYPFAVKQVKSTGTTATGIIGLY